MRQNTKILKRLLLLTTILVLSSALAAGIYIQGSKSQKQKDSRRTYEAAKVTNAPQVISKIKGVEIAGVTLINQGTSAAALSIDVTNNRDEAVMALEFLSGKHDYSGLQIDGFVQDDGAVVIIPAHTLKTFTWGLGEIMEGETVFLAAAIFADGKEEGDKHSLDSMKVHRRDFQQKQRDAKPNNGGQY